MSALTLLTLKDGSQVYQGTVNAVTNSLKVAAKENPVALFDLVKKCKDAGHQFISSPFGDSKSILTKYGLIDKNGEVHDAVKKVVLNSVEGSGIFLKLVNPLQAERVSVVESGIRVMPDKLVIPFKEERASAVESTGEKKFKSKL